MSEKLNKEEQLAKENAKLKAQLEATTEKLKVAEATKGKNAKPVVKIGSKHYEVVSGISNAQGSINRQQLAENIELCTELVAKGSGLLREVKTK